MIYSVLPNTTYGLGFKLTLTRNTNNVVLNKDNAINNAKIKINCLDWYVPHYTPSINQQNNLVNQIVSKTPIDLQNVERKCFHERGENSKFLDF